jgi:short-subunit dehydrogenase
MPLPQNLKGIITGASTGIGRSLAIQLARVYKAELVLTARSKHDLQTCQAEIEKAGGKAEIIVGDITDENMAAELADCCLTTYGGIDLLVNNAGMGIPGSFESLDMEKWRRVFEVNFFSALKTTYACLESLKKSPRGKIVNISSVAGKIAFPGSVSYCSTKFALTALSNGLAAELAPDHIDVITVCPGWVRTEFFEKNNVPDSRNPNLIAEQNNLKGYVMKNFLSVSSEDCVRDIIHALNKDEAQELILTIPGKLAERLNGLAPGLVSRLTRRLDLDKKR